MQPQYTFLQKLLAFSVHVFTSLGIVVGFMAILAIDEERFIDALLLLFITLIIDGIDGTFARMFKTNEVLPNYDGKMIDYVIDFATYAIIPAYFIYSAHIDGIYLLPENLRFWGAAIILLVSALYYGKEGMVSTDYYFVGFPVMWNMVAFYMFLVFDFSPLVNFIAIVGFAIAHFIPLKFMYPSRTPKFKGLNIVITILFIVSNILIIWLHPTVYPILIYISWFTLSYYGIMAVYHTYFDEETKNI